MNDWLKHPDGKALVQPGNADLPYSDPVPAPVTAAPDSILYAQFVAPADSSRPELSTPFTVLVDDQPFTVATNGHRMLALPGDRGFPKAEDTRRDSVPKMLATLPALTATVDLAELRKFVRAEKPETCSSCYGQASWECPECDGTGTFECMCSHCDNVHDADCMECGGDGKLYCANCTETSYYGPISPVKVGEHFFNRANIVPAVRHLPGERAAVHAPTQNAKGNLMAVHLLGEDWHVLLMPLRPDKEFATAPAFALPNAGDRTP